MADPDYLLCLWRSYLSVEVIPLRRFQFVWTRYGHEQPTIWMFSMDHLFVWANIFCAFFSVEKKIFSSWSGDLQRRGWAFNVPWLRRWSDLIGRWETSWAPPKLTRLPTFCATSSSNYRLARNVASTQRFKHETLWERGSLHTAADWYIVVSRRRPTCFPHSWCKHSRLYAICNVKSLTKSAQDKSQKCCTADRRSSFGAVFLKN